MCDYCPLKDEQWRVRLVVGVDKLVYSSNTGSPAKDMVETKLLLNSIISDPTQTARFATMDLKDMFLHTIMTEPEYMKVHYKYFPTDICQKYTLHNKVHNGYIYVKI